MCTDFPLSLHEKPSNLKAVLCSCEDSMDEIRFKVDGINITCNNNQCTVLKIDLAAPN
jgi:hypothetical protein